MKSFALIDVPYAAYPLLPLRWLLGLGTVYGAAQYVLQPELRRTITRNLATVIGEPPTSRAVRRATWEAIRTNFVRNLHLLLAPRVVARAREPIAVEGLGHLDAAFAVGRGVILMGTHINSLAQLVGVMTMRQRGYDVAASLPDQGERFAPTRLRALVNRLTGTAGFSEAINRLTVQFNVRPILQALAANRAVVMIGDGWHSVSFVDVQFMGRTVPLTTGALSVARASGAVVVPMFALGSAPDVRIVLEAPFTVSKDSPDDLAREAQRFAGRIEQYVRENPSAWQHAFVDDVFGELASWRERSLRERKAIHS